MTRRQAILLFSATVVAGAGTLFLLGLLSTPVLASPDDFFVTPAGTGIACSQSSPCDLQEALSQASDGDMVYLAQGTYTSTGSAVASVFDDITLYGGWDGTTSAPPVRDPETYTTTLDGEGQRTVVRIIGASATLEGLRMTNGSASFNFGGGVNLYNSDQAVISGCHIFSNTAPYDGGGIYIADSDGVTLRGNEIYSNMASYSGGGVCIQDSPNATLVGNRVYSNTATQRGGGIYVYTSANARLTGNEVHTNRANLYEGGGIHLGTSDNATLTDNAVFSNTAGRRGGGIYVYASTNATLARNGVATNTAGTNGGGAFFENSPAATLTANDFYSNTANFSGGGIYVYTSTNASLTGNDVYRNTAEQEGGGIYLYDSDQAGLTGNEVYSNTVGYNGGGIYLYFTEQATLAGNDVYSNTASFSGGAVGIHYSDNVTLAGNKVYANSALNDSGNSYGGGISLYYNSGSRLINNVVVGNHISATGEAQGAGIRISSGTAHLLHNTLARNSGGNGQGVFIRGSGPTAWMTNTILVSQSIGIHSDGATAYLAATLWGTGTWANSYDTAGSNIFTGTLNWWEPPDFVDASSGDYHIVGDSAARDNGVDAGVETDIDGDSRLLDGDPDLGADEHVCYVSVDGSLYDTVQAGVDAAGDGSLVKVAGTCRYVGAHYAVAYITESLTIQGGYLPSDWLTSDPVANPTTLDAQGQGRVVHITGTVTPTLEGLRLTNGYAYHGGGIWAVNARPTISGCQVFDNVAWDGGGVYLEDCDYGLMAGNTISGNAATFDGGGLHIRLSSDAQVVNNMIVENRVLDSGRGAGIYVYDCPNLHLVHTTMARNSGGDGSGIGVDNAVNVLLTNTILVSHTTGISIASGSARLEATLWGTGTWRNVADWGGAGTINTGTLAYNYWLEPGFVNPDSSNYHLGSGSGAIDRGVSTSVSTDIDGDSRPQGPNPDLGADEFLPNVYLPLVLRSY